MPFKLRHDFAGIRLEYGQAFVREEKYITLAMDGCGDRRRIAGLFIAGFPAKLAHRLLKSDDPRTGSASDVDEHEIAFDEWRTSHSEEPFLRAEFFLRGDTPLPFAIGQIPASEQP